MIKKDTMRVKLWESKLLSNKSARKRSGYVKLHVVLEGIENGPYRDVIVSTEVTIAVCHFDFFEVNLLIVLHKFYSKQQLYHQILAPVMGWKANYHAYAFRRIIWNDLSECYHENNERIFQMKKDKCWVGPQNSTATDSFFQPLCIGGCVADDRNIFLGNLLHGEFPGSNNEDKIDLEWVPILDVGGFIQSA